MNLSDYIKHLQKIEASVSNPKKIKVMYSSDDEGNSFEEVYFEPSLVKVIGDDVYTQVAKNRANAIILN